MTKYIVRRLLQAIPVLIGISIVTFFILKIAPGGPEARFAQNPRITADQIAAFRHRWGFDQPLPVQYAMWLGIWGDKGILNGLPGGSLDVAGLHIDLPGGSNGILHGDFGFSVQDGEPVSDVIAGRVLPTLILTGTAFTLWILVAFLSGVVAAVRRYSLLDTAITVFNYIGLSLPVFWLGIMLITFFSAPPLKWFPVGGMWTTRTVPIFGTDKYWAFFGAHPLNALQDLAVHLALPVITLVATQTAYDSRFIRSSMLDALNQDFIKTARAKGVPERTVVFKHALKNALLPVITNIGLEIPILFSGAVVTETIFSWPGMGRAFIDAVGHYDYPVLMGILLIAAVLVVVANLAADIAYAIVDPRVTYE